MRIVRQVLGNWRRRWRPCAGRGELHLVVEATGSYEAALVAYAHQAGWLVSRECVSPTAVRPRVRAAAAK
ncbi:MAG: hypothetical protein R3A44_12690 [Caldilineaceae bacterium]